MSPLVLECGGVCGPEGEYCWILWVLHSGKWIELGRCQAVQSEWVHVLRPLATRALRPVETPDRRYLQKQFSWICRWLDRRIQQTPKPDRLTLLEWIYDEIAARAAAELSGMPDVVFEEVTPSGEPADAR